MYYESEYLEHHGIKGQRWGVRRYQNADGSYTKAGLARYKKAYSNYEKAQKEYDRSPIKQNKIKLKNAKREEKQSYRALTRSYSADKGKALYERGYTSKSVKKGIKKETAALIAGSLIAQVGATAIGSPVLSTAVVTGAIAARTAISVKGGLRLNDLNAYYEKQYMENGAGLAEYRVSRK
jgi:hypothetical protein